MKKVRLVISGDVQGVYYRHNAKAEAGKLKLNGWIRNEPNGSVYAVVEGDDAKVDKFVRWAKKGSPMAEVETVEIAEDKYTGEESEFEVR